MEVIQLISFVGILLVLGFLTLIYRKTLPAYFVEKGKNLATKQDIADITREVERARSTFLDRQLQFTHFTQKQLDAIGVTYELLHDAQEFTSFMVHPIQSGGDDEEANRQNKAADAFNAFSGFYWKHKIYLPEHLCPKIEEIQKAIKEATITYRIARRDIQTDKSLEMWNSAFKLMNDGVPQLRTDLEKSVREIISVKPLVQTKSLPKTSLPGSLVE